MVLWTSTVPLLIYNDCPGTIWPGIYTTSGTGPGTGGFELAAGANRSLEVSTDWYGRVWGRTNCTSTTDGGLTCTTGSCGQMDCTSASGEPPATLAEILLAGGTTGTQNFVDISLVDGYNLPVALEYQADPSGQQPPPNMVNPACIATTGYLSPKNRTGTDYATSTYPMPYETHQTSSHVGHWCPWDLQILHPSKPGAGIYPYPDDHVARPVFDPCLSACKATGSEKDCCTGKYNDPDKCPRSLYSRRAKAVCPDAYSFPYDDSASTFVIPGGGGWAVRFCPAGRSTDILETFGSQISEWAASGELSADILATASNVSYIKAHGAASGVRVAGGFLGRVLVAVLVSLAVNMMA
ncbi:Thaumatin-like protein 1a [Cytospora mali]|uniref:Thaumatin-like protein 1a n=1 Tax=Cytospora mali TaxID=578113 RepID=A0A194WAX5_CYTMA|nr:Thaumatin-like protein 1a [Valsa mali]